MAGIFLVSVPLKSVKCDCLGQKAQQKANLALPDSILKRQEELTILLKATFNQSLFFHGGVKSNQIQSYTARYEFVGFLQSWSHVGVFYRDKILQHTTSEARTQERNKKNLVLLLKGPRNCWCQEKLTSCLMEKYFFMGQRHNTDIIQKNICENKEFTISC